MLTGERRRRYGRLTSPQIFLQDFAGARGGMLHSFYHHIFQFSIFETWREDNKLPSLEASFETLTGVKCKATSVIKTNNCKFPKFEFNILILFIY